MAHWSNTWRSPRFFMIDARGGIPLIPALLHITQWTIGLSLLIMFVFWLFERKGLTPPGAFRAFRAFLAGRRVNALRRQKTRHRVDYELLYRN